MDKNKHSHYFLLLALTISVVAVCLIVKPFLGTLFLAAVFAFLFQPIYKKFLGALGAREGLAAFLITIFSIILIIIPITFLGIQIFKEAAHLYQSLIGGVGGFETSIKNFLDQAHIFFPSINLDLKLDFGEYIRQALGILVHSLGALFSSVTGMFLNFFIFLIAFYFFLKDGSKLKAHLFFLSPLDDAHDEFIISRIKSGVSATLKGGLAIGLIQGILTGLGFAIFTVPNPILWGGVATMAAFIPGIGTALIMIPAVIFLFITSKTFLGIGLLVWGITIVGLVDNFLSPRLVGRGMQLHPLVAFISILGGMIFFGPLGFLLGPLIVSVCFALIDIYFSIQK
jgi:predicted PurR-regulated permease PerM